MMSDLGSIYERLFKCYKKKKVHDDEGGARKVEKNEKWMGKLLKYALKYYNYI